MAENGPTKADITAIFKRLRNIPTNKQCFDCNANLPTWASVTYGVFLCIDCSAVHRSLGVHLTFIRSTQLDTNWTWLQLRAMQVGGNANALSFFRQHGCTSNDAPQKYNSRAARMYREKLHSLASRAMQQYGNQININAEEPTSPPVDSHDKDFFKEQQDKFQPTPTSQASMLFSPSEPVPVVSNGSFTKTEPIDSDPSEGPNVEAALSMSPNTAILTAEPRKSTIGVRKPANTKKGKGLGARKGGFGAQKVKTNFSEIEAEAQQKDKEKEEVAASFAAQQAAEQENEDKRLASMRLAYQDLSVQRKKQEEKLKISDPKKAEQMERLGMGFAGSRGVSHSAISDMKTIDQETPISKDRSDRYSSRAVRDCEDEFEFVSNYPPKFDSPFGVRKDDLWGSGSNYKSNSWETDKVDSHQTMIEDIPSKEVENRGRSRKNFEVPTDDKAQKKFGNAKAISSEQFFGKNDPDFEMKQTLSRFEGQSSISSSDLFGGNGPNQRSNSHDYNQGAGPDLTEIKEGVRQGVSKVAGKLSSLANGVITSIQDHYG